MPPPGPPPPPCPECGDALSLEGRYCRECGWDADIADTRSIRLSGEGMAEAYAEPGGLDPTDPEFRRRRRTRSPRNRKALRRTVAWMLVLFLAGAAAAAARTLYDAYR